MLWIYLKWIDLNLLESFLINLNWITLWLMYLNSFEPNESEFSWIEFLWIHLLFGKFLWMYLNFFKLSRINWFEFYWILFNCISLKEQALVRTVFLLLHHDSGRVSAQSERDLGGIAWTSNVFRPPSEAPRWQKKKRMATPCQGGSYVCRRPP